MVRDKEVVLDVDDALSSEGSYNSTLAGQCCTTNKEEQSVRMEDVAQQSSGDGKKSPSVLSGGHNYASSKNVAEGLMDIALLSANANQLRFMITYNHAASTFYYSLALVILSLVLQVLVGIVLIFKRRFKRCHSRHYMRTNEVLITGVFLITVINVLLAAFTTTDGGSS